MRRCLLAGLLALTIAPLPSGAAAPDHASPLRRPVGPGTIDWQTRTITVMGEGAPPAGAPAGQARLLTQRAAVADAYRKLAETVNGVQVTVSYTAGDVTGKNPIVHTRVQGLIKGARPGEYVFRDDGKINVPMTMPLYGEQSLAWGLELGSLVKTLARTAAPAIPPAPGQYPVPETDPQPSVSRRGGGFWLAALAPFYLMANLPATGVIIDAAGLGAEPAMAPFVVGVGHRVYVGGKVTIDPDRVVQEGITTYFDDLEAAKQDPRSGANPLVVTAKGVVGRPSTDILVSDEDAMALEDLNQQTHVLDELKVSVVI